MPFRFLIDEPGEGAFNMAVDETMLLSARGPSPVATVRFYGFRPPTVSFGHRQRLSDALDVEACRSLGIGWVRRPTGGRSLLHHDELTYSIASPFEGVFRGVSVRGAYDLVSEAIRRGLTRLGIPLDSRESEGSRGREPELQVPCLALPSRHEIASGGRKVVASSQRRSHRAFLQHGSILKTVDHQLWEKVRPKSSASLSLSAIGIDELATEPIPRDRLIGVLRKAFEECFGALALSEGLTAAEHLTAERLARQYRAPEFSSSSRLIDNSEAVW